MKKLIRSSLTALALLLAAQIPNASFAADKKLEVFSWWTSGGEAAALDALFQAVKKADPSIEIINATVAGGGGSAARPVLQARLAEGNPPDSWQTHPGWELLGQYVPANYCEPINDIYQSEGWDKVVPKDLIDLLTKDGKTYAVLAGVHRGNDVDKSKFGPYHNWSMDSFAKDKLLPSCEHGEAAPAGFQQAFNDAITTFVVDKNADRLVKALADAAKEADMTK
jgi:ABC-type glycerol-3-phosphate transport system substrate-binding protein